MNRIYDASDKPLCIIGSTKLYVYVGRVMELVNFSVDEQLSVTAILESDFRDQFGECVYPRTHLEEIS